MRRRSQKIDKFFLVDFLFGLGAWIDRSLRISPRRIFYFLWNQNVVVPVKSFWHFLCSRHPNEAKFFAEVDISSKIVIAAGSVSLSPYVPSEFLVHPIDIILFIFQKVVSDPYSCSYLFWEPCHFSSNIFHVVQGCHCLFDLLIANLCIVLSHAFGGMSH